jgi:membrane-bound serine protease (ClpP class)
LRRITAFVITTVLLAIGAGPVNAAGDDRPGIAVRLEIKGAIGPATSDYIQKGIEHASAINARLVILEMDTPGGLDSAMRDIIKGIIASPVPVATWVSPSGSRAASAGTYILYASHVAAMAPATNLGAATPVQIGGGGPPLPGQPQQPAPSGDEQDPADDQAAEGDDGTDQGDDAMPAGSTAMERKTINDAVAYIRGLATLRGRNGDWAERAVREAASLSAEAALEQNVIDHVVPTLPELLAAIDGRTVKVSDGEITLATAALTVENFEPDWRTKLLATITDPNIAYMLLLVGIYGLIFEGYNPGAIVPGVVGAICLLLALFAFQVLPVNYAGLALIVLGVILMIAEAFVPSFGALGLGGIAAFVFGSVILLDSEIPGFQISRALIGGIAAVGASLLLALMYFLVRSFRRPVVSGVEEMLGSTGQVLADFDDAGPVFVHGERWRAHARQPLRKGDAVRVTAVHGLELEVEKQHEGPAPGT